MKDILKCLEAILARGYSSYMIFNDWLDLMIFALQRDDEHYLEIVRKYKNTGKRGEREIDYFCQAFAHLQMEMKKTNDDVLGQIYMQWNQNNKYRGQFFTPKHIACLIAKVIEPKGRIIDPCCGSGIMLVEALKTMDNEKLDKAVFFGQDIDLTCVKMCALNLLFFNVNGFVVWGDSLALECRKVYGTSRSYLGGSIRELTDSELEFFKARYVPSVKKLIETKPILKTQTEEQLSFF
jgi:hypothetical protein